MMEVRKKAQDSDVDNAFLIYCSFIETEISMSDHAVCLSLVHLICIFPTLFIFKFFDFWSFFGISIFSRALSNGDNMYLNL